jgi:uncharacterized protein (DUF433 family)
MEIDWNACAAIEVVLGKLSGQPAIRGTRVRPEDLILNRGEGLFWLVENFGIPAETVNGVLAFYDRHKRHRVDQARLATT